MNPNGPNRSSLRAFVAIVALAFVLRLGLSVVSLPLFDELNWMTIVDEVDLRPGSFRLPLHGDQHPPGQVYWGALGTALLGRNLLGYRFGAVVLGTIAVAATAFIARDLFGQRAGILGGFLLAVNEYHLDASHRCTEKSYLAFAAIALLLACRLANRPTTARWIGLGGALGLGALTKQSLAIWILPIAVYLARRLGLSALARRGPLLAALLLAGLLAIDLSWNLFAAKPPLDPSSKGFAFQLSRLGFGEWSWAPLALYVRPLYFHRVEGTISEYASMTSAIGVLVLASAVVGLFVLRSSEARFIQALGFGTFLFFSLASLPTGEFWWADLSLLAFVVLAAGLWGRWSERLPALFAAPALLAAVAVAHLLREDASSDFHPLEWGKPPRLVVEQFVNSQRFLFLEFKERDFVALTALAGGIAFPARASHVRNLEAYRDEVLGADPRTAAERRARGLPVVDAACVDDERAWVEREIARARGAPAT